MALQMLSRFNGADFPLRPFELAFEALDFVIDDIHVECQIVGHDPVALPHHRRDLRELIPELRLSDQVRKLEAGYPANVRI